jgi:putative membrane protein
MIERRKILAVVAVAIATPAFAQTRTRGTADARRSIGGPEEQQMQMTMTIGSLSLAVSRLAAQKVSFPKLKEFAGFEVAEQETVAGVLKSLQNPDIANRSRATSACPGPVSKFRP